VEDLRYRQRRLEILSAEAERAGDLGLAAALLEQAARDEGGRLGPCVGDGGSGRAPLPPDEARARINAWLDGRWGRRRPRARARSDGKGGKG
jgi:hypothetical protein